MLHKAIKFAYAIMLVASAAIAFIALRDFDEFATRGPSYVLTVGKSDTGADAARTAEMIQTFAANNNVNVGRLYYDQLDANRRRIYLAVGDPRAESTQWMQHGYPYFSRDANLELRPYSEIADIAPDGTYLVYGSQRIAADLQQQFRTLGYAGDQEPTFSVRLAVEHFGRGSLISCFLIVGLVAVVAVAAAVALNAKSYGIQRLHGQSFTRILLRDLRQTAIFAAAAAGATGGGTGAALFAYNRLHQVGLYTLVALAIAAIYAAAALLAHVVTLALLHRGAIVEAVKGEVTATWAIVGSYVVRCWGLLLILSIATSAVASGLVLQQERAKYLEWATLGSAYYMRINGGIEYLKNGEDIDNRIGQWIRDADTRDDVPIASRRTLPGTDHDILVVNNRYLSDHPIVAANGSRVMPATGAGMRVLVPERFAADHATISAGLARWVKLVNPAHPAATADIRLEQARDGQSLTVYTRSPDATGLTVDDPIVIVVTGASEVISNHEYVSMASNGEAVIVDPRQAMQGLTAAGVGPYILGVSPFAQDAARSYRDAKRDLSLAVFSLAAAVAVLLVTAIAVSIVYVRRNTEILFVKYLHGWSFARTHWRILSFEFSLGLILVAWVWHRSAAVISMHEQPGAPPMSPAELALGGWGPVVAGGVAAASFVLVNVVLLSTNAAFVKSHTAHI